MADSDNKKDIILKGVVPCGGYDCSDATAYITLTDEDILAIGNRYFQLIKED